MRNRIFARFVMAFTSIFMAIETNAAELGSFGPYIPGAQMELDLGLIGYKAKKLPSGLKLDKKTGFVKGKAKKPGEYISTFTKKDDETHTAKFVIGPLRTITISMEGDIEKCKVTGATKPGKGYLVGKKVTLSAKGPKGTAFNGWFMAGKPWPNESEYLESRVRHVMTEENLSLVARFEKEKMSVLCNRLLKPIPVGREFSTPILIETQSGVKSVKGSKLPTGLKVKKDKSTGAWYIQGKPKKEGVWKSTIKVTAKSGAVEQLAINVTVNDGTSSGGNLTDANGYFTDNLQNGDGEKYSLSMDSGDLDSLLPSLALSSSSAKLDVTGLPEGLTYDSSTGKIKGKATKAGSYTVTLTVTDNGSIYISTITIVVGAPANSCDLLVSSVTATRTTVYIGEKFNLRYVVKNGSNFDSQLFKNKISVPGGFSAIEQTCGGLAKNDEVAFRAQIDSGRLGVGSHIITIQADSSNDAIESDETNNQKTITLNVLELPTTNTLVDWEFKPKRENEGLGAAFLSTASAPQEKESLFNKGETIYAQINFWNNLHQVVRDQITASALLDTGVNTTWYWYGLGADVIAFIPDENRRASVLRGLQPGVYTLEILLDSDRFVNSNGDYAYYTEASKLNNSEIIEFTIAGDNKVVTFDANGGSLSPNTKSLTKGSKMGEMPTPTLKGYRFDGWYTSKEGGVEITRELIVAKNMTLYAKWTAKPYKVRYHKNDSQDTIFDQTFTTGVAGDLRGISNFGWTVNGYAFAGWATSADGEIKYRDGETISHIETDSNDVAHLYAVWTYEIILHKNDGSGTTESQTCRLRKDQHLMRINEDLEWDNPTDLFSFAGWATSPDGSVKYDDGVTVVLSMDAVINLYAVWRGTEYIVRFHKSSDSMITMDQTHTVGISKNLTTIDDIAWRMDGYEFSGWSTTQDGDVEFEDGEAVKNLKEESGAVYNLYAVWTFKVVFHKCAGSDEIVEQVHKRDNERNLLLIDRDIGWSVLGATFKGWAVTEDGDVRYADGFDSDKITPRTSEIHLYAVWGYNVVFHKNDGSGVTTNQSHTLGRELRLSKVSDDLKWRNIGHAFVGWATTPNGAKVYDDGEIVVDILSQSGAVNLYAIWNRTEYVVQFHKNYGVEGDGDIFAQTNALDEVVGLLGYTNFNWNVTGYRFSGWATTPLGDVVFSDGANFEDVGSEANYNLYAVWEYDVVYYKNDGTNESTNETFVVGKEYSLMDISSKLNWSVDNKTFIGWATNVVDYTSLADYTNAVVYTNTECVTDIKPIAGSNNPVRNLYAVWRPNTYIVKFHSNDGTRREYTREYNVDEEVELPSVDDDWGWNTLKTSLASSYDGGVSVFVGWSDKQSESIKSSNAVNVSSVVTNLAAPGDIVDLYAVWDAPRYAIIFHKSDGSGEAVTYTFVSGGDINLLDCTRNILGWSGVEGWLNDEKNYEINLSPDKPIADNGLGGYVNNDLYVDLYAIVFDYSPIIHALDNTAVLSNSINKIEFEGKRWYVVNSGYYKENSVEIDTNSIIKITINIESQSKVTFYSKKSSANSKLTFSCGTYTNSIAEVNSWKPFSCELEPGEHTLVWEFTQGSQATDKGWVDYLTLTPISGGSDILSVANTTQYAKRSIGATTTTTTSLLDSSRITGTFVDDSTLFELLVDDVNAAITNGKLTEYCEEGVITSECDVERVEEGLVLTQDNRIILIKISNGVATAEIIMD